MIKYKKFSIMDQISTYFITTNNLQKVWNFKISQMKEFEHKNYKEISQTSYQKDGKNRLCGK